MAEIKLDSLGRQISREAEIGRDVSGRNKVIQYFHHFQTVQIVL